MKQGQAFFFEKKEQKTFAPAHFWHLSNLVQPAARSEKSFLVLFFKKERLPS
jgi:hypothetical protein